MSDTMYQIIVNMRVAAGYTETGQFWLNAGEEDAREVFGQLQGSTAGLEKTMLRLDLVAQQEGLNTVLQTLDCTLEEMTENMRILMRETFRLLNLEP